MKRSAHLSARLKPLTLVMACLGLTPAMAQILPTGGVSPANSGTAVIGRATALPTGGLAMTISQTTNRAVLNWTTFSIGALDQVNVVQQAVTAVLLNRVTGSQASVIAGRLSSTLAGNPAATGGSVYLINPNGVTFANGAVVNTGGLLASTMDIDAPDQTTRNAAFMRAGVVNTDTGRAELSFAAPAQVVTSGPNVPAVTVEDGATITAVPAAATGIGGSVTLLGQAVSNSGTITATRGSVNLGSAANMTLVIDPVGDNLTTLRINNASTISALVENTGTGVINANGGLVALKAASTAAETVVNQSGTIHAQSIGTRNGQIVLDATPVANDGSTSNQIAVNGGLMDATGGDGGNGGSVSVTAPLVRFADGGIDASGLVGGSVSLNASNALTMSPTATISANGASGAGGTVVVAASPVLVQPDGSDPNSSGTPVGGAVHVSGTISAQGATDGGSITTSGATVEISSAAVIGAAGGTGANGTWTMQSTHAVRINSSNSGDAPVYDASAFPDGTAGSQVSDSAIGGALGSSTNVNINSAGMPSSFSQPPGISFDDQANIIKYVGRDSTLTLNSDTNLEMQNAGIFSNPGIGVLNVNFNTDAHGTPLTDTMPVSTQADAGVRVGNISLSNASIQTNGGSINFYGQSDPVSGRALGGSQQNTERVEFVSSNGTLDGIAIDGSTLNTCVGSSCAGIGAITLRGQGASTDQAGYINGGTGVVITASNLSTGAGAINIDGIGGLATNGVGIAGAFQGESSNLVPTVVSSVGGDINITGKSRSYVSSDPVEDYAGVDSAGVAVSAASISTGANVRITGTGADVALLRDNPAFASTIQGVADGQTYFYGASSGVSISGSSVAAGAGKSITVQGTAGTNAFTVGPDPSGSGSYVVTPDTAIAQGVDILAGANNGLSAAGGTIAITGVQSDVSLRQLSAAQISDQGIDSTGDQPQALLSTANNQGLGGTIAVTGRNVLVQGSDTVADIDASGSTGGGSVTVRASAVSGVDGTGFAALDSTTRLLANATVGGNGGSVTVIGETGLKVFGTIQANGAGAAGNGGSVDTSGGAFEMTGVTVAAAGAGTGTGGHWLIDPYDVNITHGAASGSLTSTPFSATAASSIQDGDINRALNGGVDVTVGTGTGGDPTTGDILFAAGVNIDYTAALGTRNLEFDAQRSIRSLDPNVVIQSSGSGGPLNVVFNADANNSGPTVGGGQVSYDGAVYSNGGTVNMKGNWSATGPGDTSLHLTGVIDTRVGRVDGNGGNVTLTGTTTTPGTNIGSSAPGVWLNGATISSGTGSITVLGSSTQNTGVSIDGTSGTTGLFSTTGAIAVTGLGTDSQVGSGGVVSSSGVLIGNALVSSTTGAITLHGNVQDIAKSGSTSAGVQLARGASVTTAGSADIDLTGTAATNGFGLLVGTGASLAGGHDVLLRASNDGSADAISLAGPVSAAHAIDLRPGAADTSGAASDLVTTPITVGTGASTGFALSNTDFAQLTAPAIVVGSNLQNSAITVTGALATANALSLQNSAGGGIAVNGAVTATTLGLLSGGDITEGAGGAIGATNLLVATPGSATLTNVANNVANLGFATTGAFSYVDADALTLVQTAAPTYTVPAGGLGSTGNAAQAAGSASIRTVTQDLAVGANLNIGGALALQAGGAIRSASSGVVIQTGTATAGTTNFTAAQVNYGGALYTNGGNVNMVASYAGSSAADSALHLSGIVDTRVGRTNAGAGGNVTLTGNTVTPVASSGSTQPGVWLNGSTITTGTGNVAVFGRSNQNTGVRVDGTSLAQGIFTTSGFIDLTGLGTDTPAAGSGVAASSSGVLVSSAAVSSGTGAIALEGNVADTSKSASTSAGVQLANGATVTTTGAADIGLTGSAANNGFGLLLGAGTTIGSGRNLVLRANNDGTADAIAIQSQVTSTGVTDLRPGVVNAGTGVSSDSTTTPITLGSGATTGFAVSNTDLNQIVASTVVIGSNTQAADITVTGAAETANQVTLQNGVGGNIAVNGTLLTGSLALQSGGAITESAGGTINTSSLYVNGSSVSLSSPGNNVATIGGGATNGFAYVDADSLLIGSASAVGFNAGTNTPQSTTVLGTLGAGGPVLIRTVTQDLTLDANITTTGSVDLVAGGLFNNSGNNTITASAYRIWASTWLGENRGALTGSGSLPNLYDCTYSGLCSVVVPGTDNHFIYTQQPTATVTLADASRDAGAANPAFAYSVTGTVLGDNASSFSGVPVTSAGVASPAGTYAIGGSFVSAAGYAVNVVPGRLVVNAVVAPPLPPPPVTVGAVVVPPASYVALVPLSEAFADTADIHTYTYDRNIIGPPPICTATGPLDGDAPAQGNDVLAREWSRVKARPNLTSCVSTDRRNGCSDF